MDAIEAQFARAVRGAMRQPGQAYTELSDVDRQVLASEAGRLRRRAERLEATAVVTEATTGE